MTLSNTQFNEILHEYDLTRQNNNRTRQERIEYVYSNVEGYKELDDSTASISVDLAKKKIGGDADALNELHTLLSDLKDMKRKLLKGFGLPEDYLEPIYTCNDCKDTGYIGSEKCHCLKQRIITKLYAQSNIQALIKENNFNTLSYDYYQGKDLEAFKSAVEGCHRFVDSFDQKGGNIIFEGPVGTGKSFLSGCIAKELIEKGHSVIYFSAISMFETIAKETFDSKDKEDLYNLNDYIYNCDLLIIDDLGTELTNSFVSSQLFSCINERNLRKKSTIISTNLSLQEIRNRYDERVFSRILSSYDRYVLSGSDIRILKKTM